MAWGSTKHRPVRPRPQNRPDPRVYPDLATRRGSCCRDSAAIFPSPRGSPALSSWTTTHNLFVLVAGLPRRGRAGKVSSVDTASGDWAHKVGGYLSCRIEGEPMRCDERDNRLVLARRPARPPLVCVECGREQVADERGWRSYLTTDEEEPAEGLVYCPDCARREFSDERWMP